MNDGNVLIFHLFYSSKQILYDFKVHFPQVDSDALMKNWPDFGSRIKEILSEHYRTTVSTGWPDNIEQALAIIKILPTKAGKHANSVVPFVQAIDKLIVHSEVKSINTIVE